MGKSAAQVAIAWGHQAAARLLLGLPPDAALPAPAREPEAAASEALPEGAMPLFPDAAAQAAAAEQPTASRSAGSVPENLRPEKLEL